MIHVTFSSAVDEIPLGSLVATCAAYCEELEEYHSKQAEIGGLEVSRKTQLAIRPLGLPHVSMPPVEVTFRYAGFTVLVRCYSDPVEIENQMSAAQERNQDLDEDPDARLLFLGP